MTRPTWPRHWMNEAHTAAEMSPCHRRHVGAVIVREKQQVVSGFNGPPDDAPHRGDENSAHPCVRIGIAPGAEPHKVCCTHAEQNAIATAARLGHRTEGCTMYTTWSPCATCARSIIRAGIVCVVSEARYPDAEGARVLSESKVELRWLPPGADEPLRELELLPEGLEVARGAL